MIEVEHLSKRYGEKLAAGGLDFAVQPAVTGLFGPNGAGKSTSPGPARPSSSPAAASPPRYSPPPPPAVTGIRQDLARSGRLFGLPAAQLQVVSSLAGSNEPYKAAAGEVRDAEIAHAIAPDAAVRGPAYSAGIPRDHRGDQHRAVPHRDDHRLPGRARLEPGNRLGKPRCSGTYPLLVHYG
jgi:hypothetical protein